MCGTGGRTGKMVKRGGCDRELLETAGEGKNIFFSTN